MRITWAVSQRAGAMRILENESQTTFLLTKVKGKRDEWIVDSPDQRTRGPYFNAAVALQAAAIEVLWSRSRGLKANIFVSDNNDRPRLCRLIDKVDGFERCAACQSSWSGSGVVSPKCPLWEALGSR